MQVKQKERVLAEDLRKKGLSYNEIKKQVSVSKSTLSLWCRNINLDSEQSQKLHNRTIESLENGRRKISEIKAKQSDERMRELGVSIIKIQQLYWQEQYDVPQIAKIFGIKGQYIYDLMRRHNIPRRKGTDANYLTYRYKPQFKVKKELTIEEEKLKIAGVMLYWAEGAKKSSGINFSNSDPKMIQLFLSFLHRICGINDSRLRVHLYMYSNQDLIETKKYWQRITNIPLNQFNKPYVRKNNLSKSGRKLPYGLIQIRYNDKKLLEIIRLWIEEYLDNNNLGRWRSGLSHQTVENAAFR